MSIYFASPSSQQAHTHFAVFVQVWIQSISAVRDIEEYWWRVWIVWRKLDVEKEQTVLVWCARWTLDHYCEQILFGKKQFTLSTSPSLSLSIDI